MSRRRLLVQYVLHAVMLTLCFWAGLSSAIRFLDTRSLPELGLVALASIVCPMLSDILHRFRTALDLINQKEDDDS